MILKAVFYFRWSTIFRGCDGLPGVPAGEGAQAGEQTGRPECHCSLTGESNSPKELPHLPSNPNKSFWVYQNLKDKMQKAYTSFSVFFFFLCINKFLHRNRNFCWDYIENKNCLFPIN